MTNEQRKMGKKMLESGCTYMQVAEKLGMSTSAVHAALYDPKYKELKKQKTISECYYPNLRKWMYDNDIPVGLMSSLCYVGNATMRRILSKGTMSRDIARQILRVTGMSYEEAFYKNPNK